MRRPALYLIGVFACATFFIWRMVFALEARSGILTLSMLDVGQGDAILIEAPNGNQVLIDGGPDDRVLAELAVVMAPGDRSIDAVIATHPHADHISGLLSVLDRYAVSMVMGSGANYDSAEFVAWEDAVRREGAKVVSLRSQMKIDLGSGAELHVVAPIEDVVGTTPKNAHDAMVILRLVYGKTDALFTGDAERALELALVQSRATLKSDVPKVGHHGSKTSTSELLLDAVAPEISVISVGKENRYGHPHAEITERLRRHGIRVLRTDLDGTIHLVSDGNRFSIE